MLEYFFTLSRSLLDILADSRIGFKLLLFKYDCLYKSTLDKFIPFLILNLYIYYFNAF